MPVADEYCVLPACTHESRRFKKSKEVLLKAAVEDAPFKIHSPLFFMSVSKHYDDDNLLHIKCFRIQQMCEPSRRLTVVQDHALI